MPRPRNNYERPTSVLCIVCRGQVEVEPRGRIPDGHPACVAFSQDVTRVFASLDRVLHAEGGSSTDQIKELRKFWARTVTSDGNAVWNRWDNPARRR